MSAALISGIVFACTTGGALVAMVIRARLPENHLNPDSKDVVKFAAGIVGTMTGILLGMLVSSAKTSFDSQRNGVSQFSANLVVLDRELELYGPDTKEIRELLHASAVDFIQNMWPEERSRDTQSKSAVGTEGRYEVLYEKVLTLSPKTDSQRTLHGQALKIISDTGQLRWLLYSQRSNTTPTPFLVVVACWLTLTFASVGLLAPRNGTVIAVLIACSLVVTSAIFLILELERPFSGGIRISSQPLHNALSQLDR